MGSHHTSDDPFESFLSPPEDESPEQKEARQRGEEKASRVSKSIDERLRREHVVENQRPVKILLSGQSESGKSALLKSFLLLYARHEWEEDRRAWRVVVFLNLIRSIVLILDVMLQEMSLSDDSRDSPDAEHASLAESLASTATLVDGFTDKYRSLVLRLTPLRRALGELEKMIGTGSRGIHTASSAASTEQDLDGALCSFESDSTNCWESIIGEMRLARKGGSSGPAQIRKDGNYDVSDVLVDCRQDMKSLWEDPGVQEILTYQNVNIEDSPGFFLNDIERIASPDYEPSDDDIIRARLRTVGIQEHSFVTEHGREWVMYDVGGTGSFFQRAVFKSLLDDVDAIIFLSPISGFDEPLRGQVTRLKDSYDLWRSLCSSQMPAKTQIVLLFNKCDILQRKLSRGVHVKDFITSFGERPNDATTVMQYFASEFKYLCKSVSPEPRKLHVDFASAIDEKKTAQIFDCIRDGIIREDLKRLNLV